MKARPRNSNLYVNTHTNKIKFDEVLYPCWQPDELDDSEFNLVILVSDELYRVPSIDFDFIND